MTNSNFLEGSASSGYRSISFLSGDQPRPFSWDSSSVSSSEFNINNEVTSPVLSEPVFKLREDLSQPVFGGQGGSFGGQGGNVPWRNPRSEMCGDVTSPVMYTLSSSSSRATSSTLSQDPEWWEHDDHDEDQSLPRGSDVIRSHDHPFSSSDMLSETIFRSDSNEEGSHDEVEVFTSTDQGSDSTKVNPSLTSWLDAKLSKDLSSIMPTFEFNTTPCKRLSSLSDRPMFSSSESETSSEASSTAAPPSSPDHYTLRNPRHSWAGSHLDIIDSDSGLLESSIEKLPKRAAKRSRRDSFDLSFRYKKEPSGSLKRSTMTSSAVNQNEQIGSRDTFLRFESTSFSTSPGYNENHRRSGGIPVLKHLVRNKTNTTELLIEGDKLILNFRTRKGYLCSPVRSQKKKVTLHLLDVVNAVVLVGSSTLVIQYKESCKTKQMKARRSTLDKLSDTLRSSKSNSLNRSIAVFSDSSGESEVSEIEVGKFHNCKELASLILRHRQALVPRGILKRGSVGSRPIEPILVKPAKVGLVAPPTLISHDVWEAEVVERLTYV